MVQATMFEKLNPIVIIGVIITLIILFNIALIFRYKNPSGNNENKAIKSMLNTVKSPWKDEDESLNELARLIESIEDHPPEEKNE
jgi:hypothetical protein